MNGLRALLVERGEVPLARAAHGTEPVVGDVLEGGSGSDAPVRVPVVGVVDEATAFADPALRPGLRAHGPYCARGMGDDEPGPGEELNTGPPTPPRPAASVIVLRGGDCALE